MIAKPAGLWVTQRIGSEVGTARCAVRAAFSAAQRGVKNPDASNPSFRPLYGRGHRRRDVPTWVNKDRVQWERMPGRCPQNSEAFTLIELIVSAALMSLILISAYLCLRAGVSSQRMVEPRADIIQNARVAAALLAADLRDACPLSRDNPFLGMQRTLGNKEADNLDFATHNYTPNGPHEGDFCEVSYYMDRNPETGQFSLWRRRNPMMALDPLSGGSREEIASGIVGVQFEYFDGFDWYDNWGNTEGRSQARLSSETEYESETLPEAVRMTLLFDSEPDASPEAKRLEKKPAPPFVFQTVARLVLADRPSASGSGGQSSSTASETTPVVPGT